MKTSDILEETYFALSSNKARSGLTMLGIVIGISSVIAMVAIGQGAQGSIQASIESIGSNLILVQPGVQRGVGIHVSGGMGSANTLTAEDAEAIESGISGISMIAPEASGRYQIVIKANNTNTSVAGVTPEYTTVRNVSVESGSFVSEQNIKSLSKVAILGSSVLTELFGDEAVPEDAIGQTIKINRIGFTVIGTMVSKGGTGFGSQDNMIFIPLPTAQKFLLGNDSLTTISVKAEDQKIMTTVQEDITQLLLSRHNIPNPELADFSVMNQSDIIETASSVAETFTVLLGAIAGISLLVGGIGIMNMMLTTVTERTREIGLRKAIGAKKRDISFQFLAEAVMLTFLGGVIGVILGWLISFGVDYFGVITTKVSIASVFLAFGVSALIGIVFGYYPARRASAMNPIEALRYE